MNYNIEQPEGGVPITIVAHGCNLVAVFANVINAIQSVEATAAAQTAGHLEQACVQQIASISDREAFRRTGGHLIDQFNLQTYRKIA